MRADSIHRHPGSPRPKGAPRRRERGAALVMVLLAIVVLTVFLTEVQQESSTSFAAAIAERDRLKAEYNAKSAINLSRLLISMEPTIRTNPQFAIMAAMLSTLTGGKPGTPPQLPVWAFADQTLAPYNCAERAAGFSDLAGVDLSTAENIGLAEDQGCFELVIIDEDSKININTASRDVISKQRVAEQLMGMMASPEYNPLFEQQGADGQFNDRPTVCGALIDWADSDEDRELCDLSGQAANGGAEDGYYQQQGLDYIRKNAPYDSLEELRLVRGMNDDFWATFIDPDPRDPRKRNITVWGQDKVNFNTANAQTLYSLVCAYAVGDTPICPGGASYDPAQASQLLGMISMVKAFTEGLPIFGSKKDFVNAIQGRGPIGAMLAQFAPPIQVNERVLLESLTNKSKVFSIYAEGVVPGQGRETRVGVHAVVDFRNAIELAQAGGLGATNPNANPAAALAAGAGRGAAGQADPDDPTGGLAGNPAGRVLYYRVQ